MALPLEEQSGILPQIAARASSRAALLVFICVAFVCFFRLGSTAITETDEGFAGTRADSFLRHGSWALSYDDVNDDRPQFRKPPLLYWAVAALLSLLGHTTWAVRLPTAAAGLLTAWLLFRLTREALGERAALAAALLLCTVPFFVLHVRTAMLEVPVIAALFAGLAAARLLPQTWWRPVAVGLCGGAALLIKGPGGALAAVVPVLFGLVHQRLRPRAWAEALIAVAVALALPALWYLAIPPDQRERLIAELFVGESATRVRKARVAWLRPYLGGGVLAQILRWQLPAAVCGMVLALGRSRRNPALALWLGVSVAVTACLLWAYAAMVPAYERYLLMAVPFLLSFSAYFAVEAGTSRTAGLLLVPFAVASLALDPADPWRRLPAAAALAAFAAVWTGWSPGRPWRRLVVSGALLAAVAAASWLSPASRSIGLVAGTGPRPELVPLLRQAAALIPENGKLIVERGFSVHTMRFYGRRAVETDDFWLLNTIAEREVRYAVFQGEPLVGIPGIRQEEVGRSGPWRLVRLSVEQGGRPLRGVLLVPEEKRSETANTLALLGVAHEPFIQGFLLSAVPADAEVEVPAHQQSRRVLPRPGAAPAGAPASATLTVAPGEAIEIVLASPRRVTGVDIQPPRRQAVVAGWTIEAAQDGGWSEVGRIEGPLEPYLTVAGSRVRKADLPAARVRFAPVLTAGLRLVRTADPAQAVYQVRVFEAQPGPLVRHPRQQR